MPRQLPKRGRHKKTRRPESTSAAAGATAGPQQNENSKPGVFKPETLDKSVIAIPLLRALEQYSNEPDKIHAIVIDLNLDFPDGVQGARQWVIAETRKIIEEHGINEKPGQGIDLEKSALNQQYLFAGLKARVIRELVEHDRLRSIGPSDAKTGARSSPRAIYHIWPDFKIRALLNKSISTVKADAAHASFSAFGEGIVWAVLDSGIDETHPHFQRHKNLKLQAPLQHLDFTGTGDPTRDAYGHGTHVAGIIAGEVRADGPPRSNRAQIRAGVRYRDEEGKQKHEPLPLAAISGMAPRCMLLSFKVLDDKGEGEVSSVLAAIAKIQELNGNGRRLLIHGVNMSIGYDFDPEWFACGQSPLCVEVNRLVRSGVVVVVSAGNSGYGLAQSEQEGVINAGLDMTICDPGNAESAITVGSTHRDSPHVYGVSYFSSKGPTGDGRLKPDLVAPGEKIISCGTGKLIERYQEEKCNYVENSGTSMAAPHVSGVIAAFLSIRSEFVGEPEKVKQIFLSTATDLKRERYFQGAGLVDLMRAIQSV